MDTLSKIENQAKVLEKLASLSEEIKSSFDVNVANELLSQISKTSKNTLNTLNNISADKSVNKYGLKLIPYTRFDGTVKMVVDMKNNEYQDIVRAHNQAIREKIPGAYLLSKDNYRAMASDSDIIDYFYANENEDHTILSLSPSDCRDIRLLIDLYGIEKDEERLETAKQSLKNTLKPFNREKALYNACKLCKTTDYLHKEENIYATLIKAYNVKQLLKGKSPSQYLSLNVSSRGGTGKSTDLKAWMKALGPELAGTSSPMDFFKNNPHMTNIYSTKLLVCFEECTDVGKINTTACNPIIDHDGTYEYKKLYQNVVSLKPNCCIFGASNVNIFKSTENDRRASITYFPENFRHELEELCNQDANYYDNLMNSKVENILELIKYGPDSLLDIEKFKPSINEDIRNNIDDDLIYFFTQVEDGINLLGKTISVGTLVRSMARNKLYVSQEQLALHLKDNPKRYIDRFWSKDKEKDDLVYSRFTLKDVINEEDISSQVKSHIEIETLVQNMALWDEEAKDYL